MTRSGPTTKEEFQQSLTELIVQAYENGVTIDNGGYEIRHHISDFPDMEVMVYRLENTT